MKLRQKSAMYTQEEREAQHWLYDRKYRSKQPKKKTAVQKCKHPVDILSVLTTSNAQLLVAEEPEALPFASTGHVNVLLASSTSSQSDDPLVQERTQLDIDSEQESTEQLQGTMSMECDDQVTENMSMGSAEQSGQWHSNDWSNMHTWCTSWWG